MYSFPIIESELQDRTFELAEEYCLLAVQDPKHLITYKYWNNLAKSYENSGWKQMSGQTQHQKIMKHLNKAGSITVREALIEYSVSSLTKRIQELRELGNKIISNPKVHPITGQRYVRYTLET